MQPITFDRSCYRIGGRPFYLNSGEMHYFRVPRRDWRRRMQLFKEAGGNCVATYIPWCLHEPQEGHFVFGGQDWQEFEEYLEAAREAGLYVAARPGPYQYSELRYGGLPRWLFVDYPEVLAQTAEGRPIGAAAASYVHPVFLEKVHAWFAQVCPLIARHTVGHGGPIAFTQIDNEMMGLHVWNNTVDHNQTSMGFGQSDGRFPRFLRERYGRIAALNRSYDSAYPTFEAVRPLVPAHAPFPRTAAELRRLKDLFDHYLQTVAEYAATLAGWMREAGIDTPLIHNSGNPDMNPYYREVVAALGSDFLLGSDHYYALGPDWKQNNPTPQYAARIFCSNESLRLMGFPPTVFELPAGSLSDFPPFMPEDARACYLLNLALGMKGHNYYIFTGGPNPPLVGGTTDDYDYGAAISSDGQVRPLYAVQKEFGALLAEHPWLAEAEREGDCRFALDFEHVRSSFYWQKRGDLPFSNGEAVQFMLTGPLTSAFCASYSPVLCDLGSDDWAGDTSTPLVVAASASMSAAAQERLIRFLQQGGQLLIGPVLPTLDERLEPCALLAHFLGSPEMRPYASETLRLSMDGVANIMNNGEAFVTARLPARATALLRDEDSGQVVGWERAVKAGKTANGHAGRVVVWGFRWTHAKSEHRRMMTALLERLGARQKVVCSNPTVWTSLRTSGTTNGSAGGRSLLFVMNLLSSPQEARVTCRPAWSSAPIDTGAHALQPMSVKVIALSADERGR
jgi:beta-galactosidase